MFAFRAGKTRFVRRKSVSCGLFSIRAPKNPDFHRISVVSRFESGARVCDPQALDLQADVLRLTEPRSEIRTLPDFTPLGV
jgi:hypothetical protein